MSLLVSLAPQGRLDWRRKEDHRENFPLKLCQGEGNSGIKSNLGSVGSAVGTVKFEDCWNFTFKNPCGRIHMKGKPSPLFYPLALHKAIECHWDYVVVFSGLCWIKSTCVCVSLNSLNTIVSLNFRGILWMRDRKWDCPCVEDSPAHSE